MLYRSSSCVWFTDNFSYQRILWVNSRILMSPFWRWGMAFLLFFLSLVLVLPDSSNRWLLFHVFVKVPVDYTAWLIWSHSFLSDHAIFWSDHAAFWSDHAAFWSDHIVFWSDCAAFWSDHTVFFPDLTVFWFGHIVFWWWPFLGFTGQGWCTAGGWITRGWVCQECDEIRSWGELWQVVEVRPVDIRAPGSGMLGSSTNIPPRCITSTIMTVWGGPT